MDEGSSMQILEPVANTKEEEVDQLLEGDLSELEDDDNPNEFRIHDPLPEYREYKRNLSELHSKSGFCILSRLVTLYFDRDDPCRRDITESSISERYLPFCWVICLLTFKQRWYGLTRNKHNL